MNTESEEEADEGVWCRLDSEERDENVDRNAVHRAIEEECMFQVVTPIELCDDARHAFPVRGPAWTLSTSSS